MHTEEFRVNRKLIIKSWSMIIISSPFSKRTFSCLVCFQPETQTLERLYQVADGANMSNTWRLENALPRSIKPFFDTFRSHLTLYPSIAIHFAPAVNVFWKRTYIMQITNRACIDLIAWFWPFQHNYLVLTIWFNDWLTVVSAKRPHWNDLAQQ